MERVQLEPSIQSMLGGLRAELELRDEPGALLGFFIPARDGTADEYAWAHTEFSTEEIERARREGLGRGTAEVLDRLKEA